MAKHFDFISFLRDIPQEKLRLQLGYRNLSSICRKLSGETTWTIEDAKKLEEMFPGKITRAMVRPDVYEK